MISFATILTLLRILMVPMIVFFLFLPFDWTAWAALTLYIVAAVTDFLDGWVARRFNQESDLGKFLDPIADKILVASLLITMVATGQLDGLLSLTAIIIILREILVSGLREFLSPKGISLPVTRLAKWKTTVQMLALGVLILGSLSTSLLIIGQILIILATGLTLVTGWAYLQTALRYFEVE